MNLENIILHERSQTQRPHVIRFHLRGMLRTNKFIQAEKISGGQGPEGKVKEGLIMGRRVLSEHTKKCFEIRYR
jgi:hypothetical protein